MLCRMKLEMEVNRPGEVDTYTISRELSRFRGFTHHVMPSPSAYVRACIVRVSKNEYLLTGLDSGSPIWVSGCA